MTHAGTRVVILGAGPAGVGAAYRLRRDDHAEVVVLERAPGVGGNAGSFDWNGHRLDFGSHRLHPASDDAVLADVRSLLGDDLLDRPRHGRIRLLGRWIHFPLRPLDLMLRLHPGFGLGAACDGLRKTLPRAALPESQENFATVLERSLGPTICREFYFPYAVKLWGHDPTALSAIQARRRVSASSFLKLFKKVLTAVPGFKPPGSGRFFYPRNGFGQISEAFADAAVEGGADLRLRTTVTGLERVDGTWRVEADGPDGAEIHEADLVWSTIPITLLVRMLRPAPPADVFEAAGQIAYRAMVLIYLELDVDHFTEYDAHYFPGADVRITRLSETKNYAARTGPAGRTVICAELPCDVGDDVWNLSDDGLGQLMTEDLERSGLPLPRAPLAVRVQRLPQAYPIYLTGYEKPFATLDRFASGLEALLSYGRQGLFAHDNTHHALYMANAAVDCLRDGAVDVAKWNRYREVFSTHVVED